MAYLLNNPVAILELALQHLRMTVWAVGIAAVIALPLGTWVSDRQWLRVPLLGLLSTLYTIPSLALIVLLLPLFGLNANSVIAAMVLYNQAILVRNVTVALAGIDPAILEAARGMGMTPWQRWWQVRLPLILPVFLAGVRLATVVSIAIGTLGALFAAGGLGELLFEGVTQDRPDKIWAGAIAVAGLALLLNSALRRFESWATPHSARTARQT
ncbi:MAG: ABC transporter permease [Spirulinaceae cyanobacterium SM2_1_0]|nr:ABC transporter permease [Spirulinaceae cyanobacterium SM2_1_0]